MMNCLFKHDKLATNNYSVSNATNVAISNDRRKLRKAKQVTKRIANIIALEKYHGFTFQC